LRIIINNIIFTRRFIKKRQIINFLNFLYSSLTLFNCMSLINCFVGDDGMTRLSDLELSPNEVS